MKGILWREYYGYFVAIIKEGFRNFDLKNLDLEFQIKKNRKMDIRREIERWIEKKIIIEF